MNKAQLSGHVGKDPESRTMQGGKVASFSLATTEAWKDKKTGERKEKPSGTASSMPLASSVSSRNM